MGSHPVTAMTPPATMAATDPSMSPITCSNAARALRLLLFINSHALHMLTTSPPVATTITVPPATWPGASRRRTASIAIQATIPSMSKALMNAPRTSARA